jgi:hypothetical protein
MVYRINAKMSASPKTTMAELAESEVTGALARIYDEIRVYCGVPYVSSLQRHIATMPGCLEYAWAAFRSAFLDGTIPETAWQRVNMVAVEAFPKLSPAALRLMGVDGDGIREIRNICDNFTRVSPINLLFAGCVERLIEGAVLGGKGTEQPSEKIPDMLPPMPAMIDLDATEPDIASVLMQLRTELGGKPFVPGLYRCLAHWPAYLAHAATLIKPVLNDPAAREKRASIAETIIAAADDIIASLPPVPAEYKSPSAEQGQAIIAAIKTYRVTSPEMVVFGTLLRNALPLSSTDS